MRVKDFLTLNFCKRPINPAVGDMLIYADKTTGMPVWHDNVGVHKFCTHELYAEYLRMYPMTNDIHTWLKDALPGIYYGFGYRSDVDNIPSVNMLNTCWHFIGKVIIDNSIRKIHLTAYNQFMDSLSQNSADVFVKVFDGSEWSAWISLSDGGNAHTLQGIYPNEFAPVSHSHGIDDLTGVATAAQGAKADTAVQSATIGGTAVPKSGTELQFPAYPTVPAPIEQNRGSWYPSSVYTDSSFASWGQVGKMITIQARINFIYPTSASQLIIDSLPKPAAGQTYINAIMSDSVMYSTTVFPRIAYVQDSSIYINNPEVINPILQKLYINGTYMTT